MGRLPHSSPKEPLSPKMFPLAGYGNRLQSNMNKSITLGPQAKKWELRPGFEPFTPLVGNQRGALQNDSSTFKSPCIDIYQLLPVDAAMKSTNLRLKRNPSHMDKKPRAGRQVGPRPPSNTDPLPGSKFVWRRIWRWVRTLVPLYPPDSLNKHAPNRTSQKGI